MKYLSTRGHAGRPAFCDILLGGLAPDGGLYLPESLPQVSADDLARWRDLDYADLAFEILSHARAPADSPPLPCPARSGLRLSVSPIA